MNGSYLMLQNALGTMRVFTVSESLVNTCVGSSLGGCGQVICCVAVQCVMRLQSQSAFMCDR